MEKKKIVVLLCISLLVLVGCSSKKESEEKNTKEDKIISVGSASELSTGDVSLAMDNTAVQAVSQFGEGLYAFDEEGKAMPALAENIVEPTENGLVYKFKIREASWSNGEKIKAKDFEYSWKRTVDPKTASPQAYYFSGIKNYEKIANSELEPKELGVKAVDDSTLEVTLEYPMSYFLELLAVAAFYPLNQEFVEEKGENYGTDSENILYNGAYIMSGWTGTNTEWAYEKNDNYWNKDKVNFNKVNVTVMKEENTAQNMFDSGQLDEVSVNGDIVDQYKDSPNLHIRNVPGTYYIQLNTQDNVFSNIKARQAIALSLDSKVLAQNVLRDGSTKSIGFVPKGFLNAETSKDFAEEVGDLVESDLKEAKKLWAEAMKEVGKDEITLAILCSDTDNAKKISEYIQGALNENLEGLTVEIKAVPFNNRLEMSRNGDFDIVLGGWTPVFADPVDFLNLLTENNSNNFGKWNHPKFNELINKVNGEFANDNDKRWELMMEADRIVSEEAPLIPLFQLSESYLISDKISNFKPGPLGPIYYKDLK